MITRKMMVQNRRHSNSKSNGMVHTQTILTYGGITVVEYENDSEIDLTASKYLSSRDKAERKELLAKYTELIQADEKITGKARFSKVITKP